jgi:hypothetical protein
METKSIVATDNGKGVLSGTNQTVFRRKDKNMPCYTLLQCTSAAAAMVLPPMLVLPGLNSW